MPASTEWLIWRLCALADSTKTEVNFLAVNIFVCLECLSGHALLIEPPRGIPFVSVVPDGRVHLTSVWGSQDVMTFGNDVDTVFGWGTEGSRNGDIIADVTHYTVDGRVDTESFTDDSVHKRESLELFEGGLSQ
jgi:hypothetical protein